MTYAAPAPEVGYTAPEPVVIYALPALVVEYFAPVPAVIYAAPSPVIKDGAGLVAALHRLFFDNETANFKFVFTLLGLIQDGTLLT